MAHIKKINEFIDSVNESRYETGRTDQYHNREYNWKVVFDDLKKVVLGRKKMTKPLYEALCHFTIAHYNMFGWVDYYNGNWGELADELIPTGYGGFNCPDRAPFEDIQNFLRLHDSNTIQTSYDMYRESVSDKKGTIVNENSFGVWQIEEGRFEDKLVKICRNIFKYRDDLLSIQEAAENTRNTELEFDNMSMSLRGRVIYFDYHFYNDKHVLMSIYRQNGHSCLTLTGEFSRNNVRSNAMVLFGRDLTMNESINKVSAMLGFHYHTVDGTEGIWVDLFNKGGIDKVDEISGDEFLGLFEEFDEELPSFIEYLKTELNIQ